MRAWFFAGALLCFACSSAGPYGYSRVYSPLDEESSMAEGARELDPVMMQRAPDEWKKTKVTLFGVVKNRREAPGGAAYLTLGMRTLAQRNLCDEAEESSCRVTVSVREHALVHAVVALKGQDDTGALSVQPGSLVRIIGHLSNDVDPSDGAPIVRSEYYRHWPRGEYVTMAESDHMRR